MNFLIVTGLSGSGKSGAVNALEDIGYYCIDNIPPQLIPKFADICVKSHGHMSKVAIVTDIRGGELFYELDSSLDYLRKSGLEVKVLFLDASDEVLIKRYKETRRRHPLDEQSHGSLQKAITMERGILSHIREASDYTIDTSDMTLAQLRETIFDLFMDNPDDRMSVKVMSFGFKYGISATWAGIGNAIIGSLLAWWVLGPRTREMTHRLQASTMPEFFGKRYNSRALRIAAAAIIFVFLIPYTASVYNGLSRLFGMAFALPYDVCVIGMAVVTCVYVVLGGYMATVMNDFIQGIVMLLGIIAVIVAVILLAGLIYMLCRPYKEATKLSAKV